MKKVMFVVVLLLVASTCFAQLQSGPSNTAGYVKITGPAGQYAAFGLPFKFWDVPAGGIPTYGAVSTSPSDILGDQLNCGSAGAADQVIRQDLGSFARRNCPSTWVGTLETNATMTPGHAYWYWNRTASSRDIVLAGEVDNTGNYATVNMGLAVYTPYSWRDSRSVLNDDLNLLAAGFRGGGGAGSSDQVINQTGGAFFWRSTTDNTWHTSTTNPMTTVDPGKAYWIYNRNQAGDVAWDYNYDASGASLSRGGSPKGDVGTPISKIHTTPVVKSSKEARN